MACKALADAGRNTFPTWICAFLRAPPRRASFAPRFANQTPADGKRCPLPQHLTYCGRAAVWQAARQVSVCHIDLGTILPWTHAFPRASRRAPFAPQFAKTPYRHSKRRTVTPQQNVLAQRGRVAVWCAARWANVCRYRPRHHFAMDTRLPQSACPRRASSALRNSLTKRLRTASDVHCRNT